MKFAAGDRIIIHGHRVGDHERDGEILEIRGTDEEPSYLVRWTDDGHESIIYPGTDATVQHFQHGADGTN